MNLTLAPALRVGKRATACTGLLTAVERGLHLLLDRPSQLTDAHGDALTAAAALAKLGGDGRVFTFTEGAGEPSCAIVLDTPLAITAGGMLLLMAPSAIQDRVKSGRVDGMLADTIKEVVNILSGRLEAALRATLCDPSFAFAGEAASELSAGLLVLSAAAKLNQEPVGRLQLWIGPGLCQRLK